MRICIYGAGAIGTVLGAFLARAGVDVDLVSRNESHVSGLRNKGAQIVGTIIFTVPVKALLPSEMKGKYDLVFLMTKQQENDKVIGFLRDYMRDSTAICTFQNGMPEARIAAMIGDENTFGCAVAWGATLRGDGVSELTSEKDSLTFSLGTPGRENGETLEMIKKIMENMGSVDIETNFIGARWAKLLVNASFSGMSAALGCTFGETTDRRSRKYVHAIMKECIDVAKKAGIQMAKIQGKDIVRLFDYGNPVKKLFGYSILPLAIKKHWNLRSSMLQDIAKGKKSEIDSINGVVSEYGKRLNVRTPYNDMVISVVHRIEDGEMRPSFGNARYFKEIGER